MIESMVEKARQLGREFGAQVGGWVIDGNTSKDQCNKIIRGYEDFDPEIMDMQPAPLSGENADWPTSLGIVNQVLSELEQNELSFGMIIDHNEICDAYEESFSEMYWHTVIQAAYAQSGDFEPCGVCGLYGHRVKEHAE